MWLDALRMFAGVRAMRVFAGVFDRIGMFAKRAIATHAVNRGLTTEHKKQTVLII